jgi:hypothetical protein
MANKRRNGHTGPGRAGETFVRLGTVVPVKAATPEVTHAGRLDLAG